MNKELYFDVVSDEGAGALYRLTAPDGRQSFYYHYSASDLETDKVTNSESNYSDFAGFWKAFTADPLWFCQHPLYIHPDQRTFIRRQVEDVNWYVVDDEKWRDLYARQWNKALSGPAQYYSPKPAGNGSAN